MDVCLIVAICVFSVFVGGASICPNPRTLGDHYYCMEENIRCLQCTENTFFQGTCKVDNAESDCPPCPSGTWNPKPYHLDRQCQEKKLDGKCIHPMVIGEKFYCPDTDLICIMCRKNTHYISPCTVNYMQATCLPCEPKTWNPTDYHMDKDCVPIPSNISKNPDDDAIKQSPEDFKLPQDQPREDIKEVKDQSHDSNQGMRLSISPLFCFLLWFFTFFFTT